MLYIICIFAGATLGAVSTGLFSGQRIAQQERIINDLRNERDLYKGKLKTIRKKYNEITQLQDREN